MTERINTWFSLVIAIWSFCPFEGIIAQEPEKIYEPFFAGRPPYNAFNGLVRLPDGELRHYGFEGDWFHPSAYIYLSGTAAGLSWTRTTLTDPDLFTGGNRQPAASSPWSGDYIRVTGDNVGAWVWRSRTLKNKSINDINYAHFQYAGAEPDDKGFLAGQVKDEKTVYRNCLDEILRSKLYSGSEEIYNGRKWTNERRYTGTPLLMDDYWPEADILYNGAEFRGILMNYDLPKNEIIIYNPEKGREKYIVINRDKLTGFSFLDTLTGKKRFYEYTELEGIRGKALYEKASAGKFPLFIKPLKNLKIRSVTGGPEQYSAFYEYYIDTGNGCNRFSSKKQLLRLLPAFRKDLKGYMRRNSLRINGHYPDGAVAVISYLNEKK